MRKLLAASVLLASMTLAMTGCIVVEVHKTTDAPANSSAMEKRVQELELRTTKLQTAVDALQKQTQTQQEPVTK